MMFDRVQLQKILMQHRLIYSASPEPKLKHINHIRMQGENSDTLSRLDCKKIQLREKQNYIL